MSNSPRPRTLVRNPALIRERQAKILRGAIAVISKKGFHKTTSQDIADAAGLPVGSLYQYIGRKVDVLALMASESTRLSREAVDRALAQEGDELELLTGAVRALMYSLAENRRIVKILYWETVRLPIGERRRLIEGEAELRRILEGLIRRGIDEGVFRQTDAFLAAQDIILMAHAWAIKGWAIKDRYSLDSYVEGQVEILLRVLVELDRGRDIPEPSVGSAP
jgi:TetR/AcrR family transcriptional regulator, cholesterol catabolism regulator